MLLALTQTTSTFVYYLEQKKSNTSTIVYYYMLDKNIPSIIVTDKWRMIF